MAAIDLAARDHHLTARPPSKGRKRGLLQIEPRILLKVGPYTANRNLKNKCRGMISFLPFLHQKLWCGGLYCK